MISRIAKTLAPRAAQIPDLRARLHAITVQTLEATPWFLYNIFSCWYKSMV